MKKLLPLLTCLMWVVLPHVYGQAPSPTVDGTTTSSTTTNNNQLSNSLGGNGSNSYSVDLYTGTANVNIPIYNYSVDGINAGISVSYSTSGIRVDQLASAEGLGWNLNAAPSITRQVNGLEDEATLPALGPLIYSVPLTPQTSGTWGFYGTTETDNDKFTINFGDRSVDFIAKFVDKPDPSDPIGPNQPIYFGASNNTNIQVTMYVDNIEIHTANNTSNTYRFDSAMDRQQNSHILTFRVIDEFGNQYLFDRGDYEYKLYVDTSTSPRTSYLYYPVDKWNVTQIITWKGDVINYKYTHYDNVSYPLQRSCQIKEGRQYTYEDHNNNYLTRDPEISVIEDSLLYWNGTMSQLSEIDYPNGVVAHFNTAPQARLDLANIPWLDNITLESTDNGQVDNKLKYQFNYTYFNTDPNNPVIAGPGNSLDLDMFNYRLKLDSINRVGTDMATNELYYKFAYNTSALLPQRLSPYQDVYGYYNGVTPPFNFPSSAQASGVANGFASSLPDITLCPLHTFNYSYTTGLFNNETINSSVTYGIDKTDNIYYSQSCILTSVTNGLGGTTSFFYTAHQLTNPPADTFTYIGDETINGMVVHGFYNDNGPHYYAADRATEIPTNDNPTLNMEYTNVNDGVCLSYITNTDGYNPDNNTTIKYNFQNGMRFFTGGYYWYPTVTTQPMITPGTPYIDYPAGLISQVEDSWAERIYTNSMVSSQDQINGANHGYSDATVTTLGYNNEIISSEHTHFTNVISQAGEFNEITRNKPQFDSTWNGPAPVGVSRIQASCGLFEHTVPRYIMEKHLMGLPVEVDDMDKFGDTVHKTITSYIESINDRGTPAAAISNYYPQRLFYLGTGGYYPGHSLHWPYIPFSAATAILSTSTTSYYSNGQVMMTEKTYQYDNKDNLIFTNWHGSKGEFNSIQNGITYWGASGYKINTGSCSLVNAQRVATTGLSGHVAFDQYRITSLNTEKITTPVSTSSYGDWDYQDYTVVDANNNVCEVWHQNANTYNSALWDNRIGKKVASVMNSKYTDMAYTSFEGGFLSGADSNKGHWNFNNSMVAYDPASKPMTGKYYYNLTGTDHITSEYPLTSGKKYYFSFWALGTVPNMYLNTASQPGTVGLSPQNTVNGWTLYTGYVTGNGYTLFLAFTSNPIGQGLASTCKLDELRLYPADATMETFTYEPLLGPSSHCDDRNNITYMQYDVQGRPSITRDINGNILSVTKHVNQGNDN